jgi:hypothetical protein
MKNKIIKVLAMASVFGSAGGAVQAGQPDDIQARLAVLERENAAVRKENAALRENKTLRAQHDRLNAAESRTTAARSVQAPEPAAKRSWFESYAADLPVAYKAPVAEAPGQLRFWAEGGAIWSGGDPVSQNFSLIDFTGLGGLGAVGGGIGGGSIPRTFDLTPKVGWEAATGFDYRFAGSPWHVSGQFRYGEGGKTSGSASSAGSVDPALLALLGGGLPPGSSIGGSQNVAASYQEARWLADLAVGRDVVGSGADAMQLKGGLRVAEFTARTNTSNNSSVLENFGVPITVAAGFPKTSFLAFANSEAVDTRARFLGAGPLIGIQGSVPFAGKWSFDYLGDAAVLFGTQRLDQTTTTTSTISPAFLAAFGGAGGSVFTSTAEQFATVFSADIQVGLSYWLTQNVKVGASYRLDALINVWNQDGAAGANLTPDRYTHGPRLTVTGQF